MQKIYYGAPGTGKSFEIDTFLKSEGIREEYIFRITFHPDFSYSDFIGQLLPTVIKSGPAKGDITYDFLKGFSLRLLKNRTRIRQRMSISYWKKCLVEIAQQFLAISFNCLTGRKRDSTKAIVSIL